jgi:hypothetical protein
MLRWGRLGHIGQMGEVALYCDSLGLVGYGKCTEGASWCSAGGTPEACRGGMLRAFSPVGLPQVGAPSVLRGRYTVAAPQEVSRCLHRRV